MASMFMREARMMQYYRPSLQLPYKAADTSVHAIRNVYRSATCNFSESSGPVRYVPKVHKKTPAQRQFEHTKSGLNHPIHDEGASTHACKVPSEAQQGVTDPSLVEWGHLDAGSGFFEENHMHKASLQPSCDSSRKREISSSECLGTQISAQHMPVFSQHGLGRVHMLSSSCHPGKDMERNSTKTRPITEEDRSTQPSYVETQNIACCKTDSARQLPRSSPYLTMPTLPRNVSQTGNKDVEKLEDTVQTRENDLLSIKAERKAFLQAAKRSPLLSAHSKDLKKREADIQGKKMLPWQDAESFLLKVQRAKQKSSEPIQMPHVAANDDSEDKDFTCDDGFLLCEQETFEQSEDVHKAPKGLGSHSTAEQEHAKNQAIRCLSMRPYTAHQLRKKLIDRSITPDLADYAISSVQSCGLQSDLAFAEMFSCSRFNHGSWGPQRIKLGLKQRGISDEIIKAAIDRVFVDEEGNVEQNGTSENGSSYTSVKMSKDSMDHLLVQATKQWNRGRNATHETKSRRMVSWLQYRGFNYSVIKCVLNHLQKEIPMEDEL